MKKFSSYNIIKSTSLSERGFNMEKENEFEIVNQETEVKTEITEKVEDETNEKEKNEENKYGSPELQEIENARSIFLKQYRSGNRIKSFIFVIVLIILCASFIVIPNVAQGAPYQLPLMLGIAVVTLGGILVYTILTRKSMKARMHNYFETYYGNLNKYVFSNKSFEDIKFQNPGKIPDELFLNAEMYVNILEVRSRGATTFKYKGQEMTVCDCAGSIKNDKRIVPAFVGKYVCTSNSYEGKDQILIYIKGDKRALPPTNIEDKKIVFDDKNMVIYSNNKKWKDVVTSELMKKISNIKPNKELVDITISIQPGKTYVAMGYDDPLMVVPLEQELDVKPIEYYKKDILKVCEFLKELK